MLQQERPRGREFRVPEVVAHRGGGREVPENTWAAVEHTVGLGLRWMETDLHVTGDGVVILWHDPSFQRVANQTVPISQQTWQEISGQDVGDGRPPVRLDDVLHAFPELHLNMDLKVPEVVQPALQVARAADALERVRFASFSARRLAVLRRQEPRATTSVGTSDVAGLLLRAESGLPLPRTRWSWVQGRSKVDCVQVPTAHKGIPVVTERFVAAAHRYGLEVHVWTVDDPAEMERLAAMNVDALITDVPTVALEVVGRLKQA
ncbi:Glycerophosphoryl diester phosphodiesterase [Actinomyces bovis]|uniref:Glycerophosphoryl diester phosphodiesterase n=1 Tax=Actinomyces bovis TaxID=1658 RepID=A0ABY1VMP7_9ACTO|nr:glycerophosphodiester phosphodiesterase [Actinomyces bovis]SPT53384.1 Glycerophosphoryl diester phosphodiesterase [Actinomyces bovis]VEG52785.1 Glycerophosphoryl diester phosphodiesterase [Actinomyces israelii]